ncbi:MAG: RDD family protein [Candidatus Bathyarchaeia archaeon]
MEAFECKGLGPRLLAYLVDSIVLAALFSGLNMALFGDPLPLGELYVALGIYFFIQVGYFTVMEGFSGASLGKRLLRLKVLRERGGPCGFGAAFVRNFLRLVDMLPGLYIVGIISILRSANKQRLGDRLAGTIVVDARPERMRGPSERQKVETTMRSMAFRKYCVGCGEALGWEAVYCPRCGCAQPVLEAG